MLIIPQRVDSNPDPINPPSPSFTLEQCLEEVRKYRESLDGILDTDSIHVDDRKAEARTNFMLEDPSDWIHASSLFSAGVSICEYLQEPDEGFTAPSFDDVSRSDWESVSYPVGAQMRTQRGFPLLHAQTGIFSESKRIGGGKMAYAFTTRQQTSAFARSAKRARR